MTKQRVYNKTVRHLLSQRKKSMNFSGVCAYLNEDGLMCAVGCHISRKNYSVDIEGIGLTTISYGIYAEDEGMLLQILADSNLLEHLQLLIKLQDVHDCMPVNQWRKGLRAVAAEFGLSDKVLN